MRNFVMTLALACVLIAGLTATPAAHAQGSQGPGSSRKGPEMQRMMMMKMMEKCEKMMEGGMRGGMTRNPGSRKPNKK